MVVTLFPMATIKGDCVFVNPTTGRTYISMDDFHVVDITAPSVPLPYEQVAIRYNLDVASVKTETESFHKWVCDGQLRPYMADGLSTFEYASHLCCDFCRFGISSVVTEYETIYRQKCDRLYRCLNCHLDMCLLCFLETDAEVAAKHGSQRWATRREKLDACRSHRLRLTPIGPSYEPRTCDVCENYIVGNFQQRADTDVCADCALTEQGTWLLSEPGFEAYQHRFAWDVANIGSLLEWIVIKDFQDDGMILARGDSLLFVGEEGHGRQSYHLVNVDNPETIIAQFRDNDSASFLDYMSNNNMEIV